MDGGRFPWESCKCSSNSNTERSMLMNWDQVSGKWEQFKGQARVQWGKLTDDDLEKARGDRDILVGKIQERYGIAKEEAERRANVWFESL